MPAAQGLSIFVTGKINKYPLKVQKILRGELVEPISVEFHLSEPCNHKCPQCFGQFEGKTVNSKFMKVDDFKRLHDELQNLHFDNEEHEKGISFSGSTGDPLLNPHYPEILGYTKLPFIVLTNGGNKVVDKSLARARGLRISFDAVDADSHFRTHGVKGNFEKVCENIRSMVAIKKETKAEQLSIGAAFLTGVYPADEKFPEPYGFMEAEMDRAIELGAQLGVNYVQFRPLHHDLHNFSEYRANLKKRSLPLPVLFSTKYDYMSDSSVPLVFPTCESNHVMLYISSNLDVYTCCHLVGLQAAKVGNLSATTLAELLQSRRRKEVYEQYPNAKDCPEVCKGHAGNANIAAIRAGIGKAQRDQPIGPHDVFL